MFCTKCGNRLSDTAKFCPVCGTPVDRGIPGPVVTNADTLQAPNDNMIQMPAADTTQMPAADTTQMPAADTVQTPPKETPQAPIDIQVQMPAADAVQTPPQETPQAPNDIPVQMPAADTVQTAPQDTQRIPNNVIQMPIGDACRMPDIGGAAQKKKSKKGLVIILCSAVALLGIAVGLAFFFSSRYSNKVDELESYQSSSLIENMKSEYDDLLIRAQAGEGVLKVFGSFSLGSEIDSFIERINERKTALPEEALQAVRKLEKLGEKYNIEEWGARISKYGLDVNGKISGEDYEGLAAIIKDCDRLSAEIIDTNNKNKAELEVVKNKIVDLRSTHSSYAIFKNEADDFIEHVNNVLASATTVDVPYYLLKGKELIRNIEDANRPYKEIEERKEYYDTLFSDVEMMDEDRYNEILIAYSDALVGGEDADIISDIVSQYATFYEETHEANMEAYAKFCDRIDRFDVTKLTEEESPLFNDAYDAMVQAANEDKLSQALENARICITYVDEYAVSIKDCDRFISLVSNMVSDYFTLFDYHYDGELSEEEMYFICEHVLTDEIKDELRNTLGWGAAPLQEAVTEYSEEDLKELEEQMAEAAAGYGSWTCGFSRTECEDLAYFITGNKHYFYKDIALYSARFEDDYGYYYVGNMDSVRISDIEVTEQDDGSLLLEYDENIFFDGLNYKAHMLVTAVSNPDSFFDGYSIAGIDMTDVEELHYEDAYLKALEEIYNYEPEQYGDDAFSRHFSYVYVNGDFIPEIYVNSVFGYASAYLISYTGGDDYHITALESGDGFSEYISGKGVIRICDGRQGYYEDAVVLLKNDGTTETVFSGEYHYIDMDSDEMSYNIKYPVEEENADATVYYDYLDEYYTSMGESSYLSGDYTYDFMYKSLSDYTPY
ncbi:MAG: zinc-ribbon domain-containing protein [Lachnospiraceae bacterium]|nr:zinc-ribbon domain-containing protein [Lachnospiraceae bacterium]